MRKYKVDLGTDALGNLTRIENEIAKIPARLETAKTRKEETTAQLETAKEMMSQSRTTGSQRKNARTGSVKSSLHICTADFGVL